MLVGAGDPIPGTHTILGGLIHEYETAA